MTPMFKLDIDTSNLTRACQAIAQYSGADLKDVIDHEAARTLEATIKYTPAANVSKLRAASEKQEFASYDEGLYTPTSRSGLRHRPGVRTTKRGFITYYLGNRYPTELWSRIEQARKASLQAKLKARGLAKKSWLMIATALGLEIRVPGFVSKATDHGREYPGDVTATRTDYRGRYGIFCANASPLMAAAGVRGAIALQRAINGRAKFFDTNFRQGVFFALNRIRAKYPGMKIR